MSHPAIEAAQELAEGVLFPTALATDASDAAPRGHIDALASAGLYGITGPREYGGRELDEPTFLKVTEVLASGCLTTTFIWAQHVTPVRELTHTNNDVLRDEWLARLCTGEVRSGIALGGVHEGAAGLKAEPAEGGWRISGEAPYVTGWGCIDLMLMSALTADGRVVRALADAVESAEVRPERLHLVAANASNTVRLRVDGLFVPAECVTSIEDNVPPPPNDGGTKSGGALALGVTRRCLALLGPSGLDAELEARREQLVTASKEEVAAARAAAAELAVRAAAATVVRNGSRSIYLDQHAQRLYREAAFLLVFGTRPATRALLMQHLKATPVPEGS